MTGSHLILAGAGHAQLDLLAALVRQPLTGWQVTVVSPSPEFSYSGMLPAIVAGRIDPASAQIPVEQLATAAGAVFRLASVTALDPVRRTLTLSDGATLPFDILSLDVGSAVSRAGVPGADAHAFVMRPFRDALRMLTHLNQVLGQSAPGAVVSAAVVGAGAAGVEIALAMRARIVAAGRNAEVTLIDSRIAGDGRPLPGFSDHARSVAKRMLARRGVRIVAGAVVAVRDDAVIAARDGNTVTISSHCTAWVAGPSAHPWLRDSGLPCDASGYPLVSDTLALDAESHLFGGGDCVTLRSSPTTPKAGVFAVRMAPVLAANVLARARGEAPSARYSPQHSYLALLSTGDGRAMLRWRGLAFESSAAQWLKTWIDERYLRRYLALAPRRG
jgi:NADH dehydrogenase FAD-containing subunit